MIDPFGRPITYLRVSVTDRCDLRCVYCMAEDMTFLPKRELLTLEELDRLSGAFIRLGTTKIRITGGEPLVRRDIDHLFRSLGSRLDPKGPGLKELTVTTNGTQLTKHAVGLYAAGVRRINVSLDSLDPGRFTQLTRLGKIEQTLDGIFAAKAAGLAVTHIGHGPLVPLAADTATREAQAETIRRSLELARTLGARCVYGPPGGAPPPRRRGAPRASRGAPCRAPPGSRSRARSRPC